MFNFQFVKKASIAATAAAMIFSFAPAAHATPSLGASSSTLTLQAYQPAALNSLLGANPVSLSGYNSDQILLATISTTSGTVKISATEGLTTATGYQNPVTAEASSIAFAGTQANINAALNTLKVTPGVATTSANSVTITVSNRGAGQVAYNPFNGHYYEFINTAALNWDSAYKEITGITLGSGPLSATDISTRQAQTVSSGCAKTFNGMCGYFATVTSEAENAFITTKVGTAAAWLGGSDRKTYKSWYWYDPKAPEYGTQFANESASVNGSYVNWNRGEPNGNGTEQALQILSGGGGKWNNLREDHTDPAAKMGYVVEYGGNSGETPTIASASRTINFSETFNVAYDANQGTGTVPAEGWYTIGQTFTVPSGAGLTRDGYAFDGWYDGTTKIAAGSTYTMPAYNRSFQAQWVVSIPVQKDSVTAVTPAQGVQGTNVTISGSFTRKVTEIRVDTAIVSASQITQTETSLKFAMPRHLYGSATIYVINGAEPALKGLAFKYLTAAEASASPTPSASPKATTSASPSPSPSASPSTSPKPSSAAAAGLIPYDGLWGTVTFTGTGTKLSSTETTNLNTLLKSIADMAGNKTVTLSYLKVINFSNKTVAAFNKDVDARVKLITDKLKAKVPGITINENGSEVKVPSKLSSLKSDTKWLQIKINLKVS